MEIPAVPLQAAKAGVPVSAADASLAPTPVPAAEIDQAFSRTTNLASAGLNASILSRSDEWFAEASNLLTPTAPISRPGVFVHTGAWYDGWETRRHNPAPYDWTVIKLGVGSGSIEGIEVDTAFFVGNFGEKVEVQATYVPDAQPEQDQQIASPDYEGWKTILPIQACGPSQRRAWRLHPSVKDTPFTHVRLHMYPDGGIARLRLYGHAIPPPQAAVQSAGDPKEEELSSALLGGLILAASDQHYTPAANILLPGRGKDMGDGWETARSRTPGHVDWAISRLGLAGTVSRIVVDTKDFRGNFPRAVRVHAFPVDADKAGTSVDEDPRPDHPGWVDLLKAGEYRCRADTEHVLGQEELVNTAGQRFSHAMVTMVPDGGIKRFRVFGTR